MMLFPLTHQKMRWLAGAVTLSLLLAPSAQAVTIQEKLTAAARQPGVAASELAAREGRLREQAATAALFPRINAFGKAEFYNSPTNLRPMVPTEVDIQAGDSIPFSCDILRYGLTLDMPLFVKSLYDLRRKSALLAEKASLAHALELSSRKAAVVAATAAWSIYSAWTRPLTPVWCRLPRPARIWDSRSRSAAWPRWNSSRWKAPSTT